MLAVTLAHTAACSDAAAPVQAKSPVPPAAPTPPVPVSNDLLILTPSNLSVLVDDTLPITGYVYRASRLDADSLDWQVSDTTIASVTVAAKNRIVLHVRRAGELTISASTRDSSHLFAASTGLKVLVRSLQPAPIDVTEFYAIEQWIPSINRWYYAPQLTLRAFGQDAVQIVSVKFEIPDVAPAAYCRTDHSVAAANRPMFPPPGDGGLMAVSDSGHRAPPGAQAVARITVLSNDGTATQLVVRGEIDSGTIWASYNEAPGDWMWCE